MLEFKPVELSDKSWVDPLVLAEDSLSADYNFGNIFMWDLSFRQLLSRLGDRMVVMPTYGEKPFFAYPVGSGDIGPVVEEMHAYARDHGFPLVIRGVTAGHIPLLEAAFPGQFDFTPNRAYWDYVYSAEKLSTLAGKKLHGKRNHVNRFLEENDWSFEPLTARTVDECMAMLDDWTARNAAFEGEGLDDEHAAIGRGFSNFDALGLEGGILRVEGRLVAFTVGEKISSAGFNVHFEKAYADVNGAYPMVNREFVRQIRAAHPEIVYINREDDMGHENLRQAKLSYHPELLVEKYTAAWKGEV